MKIHPAPQGTLEWLDARLGLPTASQFHKIVTPKTLKLSEQRHDYMHRLLGEWLTGESCDQTPTAVMDRGTELEPEARAWYEFQHDVKVEEVGLCLTDDLKLGASPDGLIPALKKGIEIKCPMTPGMVAYLLGSLKASEEYRLQVQGGLYVTGYETWDTVVYHPSLPKVVLTVEPEKDAQEALAYALPLFLSDLEQAKAYLLEKGCKPKGKELAVELVK